jgi:hypothetical protein
MGPGFGFDFMFNIMPLFFFIIFAIVIGAFIFAAVKGIKTWNYNNSQPVLNVQAKVVSKRADVSSHMHSDADGIGHHHHSTTTYYATFQVESGDRMELHINGSEYGMLAEGDCGKLTFQGTRYLGFERQEL